MVFISRGVKSSLQRELDTFYKEVTGSDFNIREVTKGAFTQARSKLSHEVFIGGNSIEDIHKGGQGFDVKVGKYSIESFKLIKDIHQTE